MLDVHAQARFTVPCAVSADEVRHFAGAQFTRRGDRALRLLVARHARPRLTPCGSRFSRARVRSFDGSLTRGTARARALGVQMSAKVPLERPGPESSIS